MDQSLLFSKDSKNDEEAPKGFERFFKKKKQREVSQTEESSDKKEEPGKFIRKLLNFVQLRSPKRRKLNVKKVRTAPKTIKASKTNSRVSSRTPITTQGLRDGLLRCSLLVPCTTWSTTRPQ